MKGAIKKYIFFFGIEVAIPIMFIQAINKACGRGRFEVM